MRILAGTLLIISLFIQGSFPQQPVKIERQAEDFIPMAVWYGGGKARAPMLEPDPRSKREAWRADLQQIKGLGFNAIKCWVDWSSAEPAESQFNFDTVDVLFELAREAGLKVYIQIYADSAPDWVGRKYPDSHFVDISGAVMPSEAAPGYCFDHPGVRKAMLEFFRVLAERVKGQPAFMGWDLWSEPHVINWASATYLRSPEFCFCPHSVARYREWLKHKYGSLDALNQAWYRRFSDWKEVEPNRLSTILSYTDYVDWRFFIIDKLAEDLRMRYEAVKRVIPGRIATSHAASPSLFTSPTAGEGNPDDWLMAKQVDYWGTSFYPKHSSPVGRDPAWRGALLDFSRSACATQQNGFYIGELQAGFGTVALRIGATVTPEDERIWMWSALARGAKGINVYAWYPMNAGYESGGYGLIQLDGTLTERAKVVGSIARLVDHNQQLFLKAQPSPAEVAIVYNPLSYLVGGRQPLPTPGAQSEFAGIERNSLLGIYRALMPTHVPVDFIHINEIADGKAGRYKLILLPYPLMIPKAAGRGLTEYVRQGGTLMTEARLAWNDEQGHAKEIIPGFGLHEVTGCREVAVQQTPTGKTEMQIVVDDESIPLLHPGFRVRGWSYEEALHPLSPSARIIAKFNNGDPAIIASNYGKGKVITIGSFLGALYEAERDVNVGRFFSGLLEWAGITRQVEVDGVLPEQSVEIRTMEAGLEKLLVVFNHGNTAAEPTVRMKLSEGTYSVTDLMTREPIRAIYDRSALSFRKRVGPGEVWAVLIQP
ncbi:MAG: beta-galactosidase [Acidobacteriia bacterium]|nr:beta-galactosidase [Terriglobia bacterium]